jgi:hypothetical protein
MRRSCVLLSALIGASAVLLSVGCAGSADRARPSTDPAGASPTTSAGVRDFQVQLRDISASTRRSFVATGDSSSRSPNGASIQLSIALQDAIGGRLFRVRDSSAIRSVTDGSGRELLKPGDGALKSVSYGGRSDFAVSADRSAGPATYQVSITAPRVPESIRRVSGEFRVEVAVADVDRTVPIASVEEPFEVCPGVTAVVKLLDVPEPPPAPATGPSSSSSQQSQPPRISVEVRTRAASADQLAPVVLSVEVLDATGGVLMPLARREESTVGAVFRRRFSTDGNSYSRPERGGPKPPKSFRFQILTSIESVTVPFEFGPLDLAGD